MEDGPARAVGATLTSLARYCSTAILARRFATWLHECAHVFVARCLGHTVAVDINSSTWSTVVVSEACLTANQAKAIRHAGWVASLIFSLATVWLSWELGFVEREDGTFELHLVTMAFGLVALEAVQSDLLSFKRPFGRFYCGNFGLVLLSQASSKRVGHLLRRMLKITMMRGAQSAGLVTYQMRGKQSCGARFRTGRPQTPSV